jgi:hypothetical protein
MLKRLLEACLVKPTDGIQMTIRPVSRSDDQGTTTRNRLAKRERERARERASAPKWRIVNGG